MYCNDRDALIRCPQFKDMISEIITDAPRSVMTNTSVKKVMAAVEANLLQDLLLLFSIFHLRLEPCLVASIKACSFLYLLTILASSTPIIYLEFYI